MQNYSNGDRCIAKLQYFADYMQQRVLEKESLAVVLGQSDLTSDIRTEILVYEEILEEYYKIFEDILHKE